MNESFNLFDITGYVLRRKVDFIFVSPIDNTCKIYKHSRSPLYDI